MNKLEVQSRLKAAGKYQWELAEAVGVSEYILCTWLRHELTGTRLERVKAALEKLEGEGGKV